MEEQCMQARLPEPIFTNDGSDFWVIFRKDSHNTENMSRQELNERQADVIDYIKENGGITSSAYAKRYGVSERTARVDLNGLVDKQIITNVGKTNNSRYVLK